MFVMQEKTSLLEILIEAKRLINEPNGWLKFKLHDGEGGYCALGAVYGAAEGSLSPRCDSVAGNMAHRHLALYAPGGVAELNNKGTLEDVNKMFCQAIEKAAEDQVREEASND